MPGGEVVRGDLVVLAEGDRVPADMTVAVANDLMVDESLLSRESLPVERPVGSAVYAGTLVVKGQGRGGVTATGDRTEFERIGRSIASLDVETTPLQRETGRIVRALAAGGVTLCVLLALYHAG